MKNILGIDFIQGLILHGKCLNFCKRSVNVVHKEKMENLISQQRSKSQISNSTFFQIICFFCIICRTLSLLYFIFIYILHHISYGIIATFHYFMNPPSKLTMSVLLLPPKAFIKSLVKTESLLKKHYNPLHPGSSLPHSDPDVIQLSKET